MPGTPLFDHMRDEHRRLLGRIDAVAARYAEARAPLAPLPADVRAETAALGLELRDHLDLEDEQVYTALARLLPETAPHLAALRAQRAELRTMLQALLAGLAEPGSSERDEQLAVECDDLFALLRIHVRKEEALVFGLAERALPTKGDLT